jgi:hypothetical protein
MYGAPMSSGLNSLRGTFNKMIESLSLQALSVSAPCESLQLLDLPGEIIENILRYLDGDSLKALRRSCGAFLESTGPLLFGTIRIRFQSPDLERIAFISESDTLRHYVHTVVYVADEFRDYHTFSHWKGALGVSDPSPSPAHYRMSPIPQSAPWTLEHAQWRGFRRHQQVRKDQTVRSPYEGMESL